MVLALLAGLAAAQGPEPPAGAVSPEGEAEAAAIVRDALPIQGRLTDQSGNPLDGLYNITASIYDASSGGTLLCDDIKAVQVNNGLFTMSMNNCTVSDINGDQLYLGIKVGSDPEMSPRQAIYPVPYARSLRPGAQVFGTVSESPYGVITAWNTATSGAAYGVYGGSDSTSGRGIFGKATHSGGVGGYFAHDLADGVALMAGGSGIIRSTAKSYLWIGGNGVRPYHQNDSTIIDMDTVGGAKIYQGATAGNKNVMLPIAIPGPLYGQNVTISGMDIYWVGEGDLDGISAVLMRRQTGVCASASCYATILYDTADHVCDDGNFPTGCTLSYPLTSNNVLTANSGILYLTLELAFAGSTTWVEIGGVRLTLEHN
jgi:hypothetical protein